MMPNFMPWTDNNEKRTMYSKSDSNEVLIGNDTKEVIQELFAPQIHYICNKRSINHGESYIYFL